MIYTIWIALHCDNIKHNLVLLYQNSMDFPFAYEYVLLIYITAQFASIKYLYQNM